MDRDRLKEVHQTDLTEGRINQDFLDWLQTKGMSYLLVVLLVLCGYFAFVRWQRYRTGVETDAWTELASARLPAAYQEVAEKYPKVGAVADLARLRAADALIRAVQTGQALGAEGDAPKDLNPEDRKQYLDRADALYVQLAQTDDQSNGKALVVATALTGRAAIAESRGDAEQARQFYNQAAQRAESFYPILAEQARKRAQGVDQHLRTVTLQSQAEISAIQQKHKPQPLDPVNLDQWVRDLVMPKNSADDDEMNWEP